MLYFSAQNQEVYKNASLWIVNESVCVCVCAHFWRDAQLYMPNVIYLHLNSINQVISFSPGSSWKLSSLSLSPCLGLSIPASLSFHAIRILQAISANYICHSCHQCHAEAECISTEAVTHVSLFCPRQPSHSDICLCNNCQHPRAKKMNDGFRSENKNSLYTYNKNRGKAML